MFLHVVEVVVHLRNFTLPWFLGSPSYPEIQYHKNFCCLSDRFSTRLLKIFKLSSQVVLTGPPTVWISDNYHESAEILAMHCQFMSYCIGFMFNGTKCAFDLLEKINCMMLTCSLWSQCHQCSANVQCMYTSLADKNKCK